MEAGVATVMTAHNELNGVPCHANPWLVQDILRKELGFNGFVVSDWMDIERLHSMHHLVPDVDEAFLLSVESGIDMHMQGDRYFETVLQGVRNGRIPEKRIDEAAGKILTAKFALGLFEDPIPPLPAERGFPADAAHRQTSLEAARESIVLLKNDGILPLGAYRRIFLCGPNADSQTQLGDWVVPQEEEDVITVFEGLREAFPQAHIDTLFFGGRVTGVDDAGLAKASSLARTAELNILVLGDNSQRYSSFGRTCGENCDRDNIALPGRQQELLEAVAASGRPTVLLLMSGRALGVEWAAGSKAVNAIVNTWEPGQMGGQAIAEILTGAVNPSGKLPVTIPRNAGQIQCVYNHKHSQYSRHFALAEQGPLYPFGFGLSYTRFEYGKPQLEKSVIGAGESVRLSITLTNAGPRDGAETVQLYIRDEYGSVTRPVKELKAVQKSFLKAGESTTLTFEITPAMLACWGAGQKWEVEPGDFTVMLGSTSADEGLQSVSLKVQ